MSSRKAKSAATSESLSAADAAFLYLERKEIPLHIASVLIFDGPIPFKEFVARIRSKLPLVPRYRQMVVTPPWNLGAPYWEDDPHFDVHRHIFEVRLDPPGGEAQLETLAGRILSGLLDRSKPLWDMYVVDGLKDGQGAIIWRMHHALADGISGLQMLKMMLESSPEVSRGTDKARCRPPRPRTPENSSADGALNSVRSTLGKLIAFEKGLLAFAEALSSDQMQDGLKGLLKLAPEVAASVERLPFNKPCGGERKFCWGEFDLAEVQAIREAAGGTVNDVILTLLTRALARYVKLHGQTTVNRFVRIVCPVNLRRGDEAENLGNQISFLPVALPMDVRNPVRMLKAVAARTETMKRAGVANLVGLAASCITAAPPPLQALLWRGIPEVILPVPLFNLICTNVAGSPVPLYAVGRQLIASYPQVPTGWDLGVGCAVQSYNGKLCFGLIADAHAAPDVARLRDFLSVSFQELRRAVELKKARSRKGTASKPPTQTGERAWPVQASAPEAAPARARGAA